jgi:hypothetical protein
LVSGDQIDPIATITLINEMKKEVHKFTTTYNQHFDEVKEFVAKANTLLNKSSPSTIDPIQSEVTIARVPIALEGRAQATTMSTSSMLDTKTNPDLLPTDSNMGSWRSTRPQKIRIAKSPPRILRRKPTVQRRQLGVLSSKCRWNAPDCQKLLRS